MPAPQVYLPTSSEQLSSSIASSTTSQTTSSSVASSASSIASSTTSVSSTPTSSSEGPVVDTNVYRILGDFVTPNWDQTNDNYIMGRVGETNVFIYEGLDLFVDKEWGITLNGSWTGQIGFNTTTNLTIVYDPIDTHVLGGGMGSTKNFKVAVAGNYDIQLDTTLVQRVLTITRNGDPVGEPGDPVIEVDPLEWHLAGNFNSWAAADPLSSPLVYNEVTETYDGTFEFEAGAQFKIVSAAEGYQWAYARGAWNVEVPVPQPAWLDLTDAGGAIIITEAGSYTITFAFIASVDADINGLITITQLV